MKKLMILVVAGLISSAAYAGDIGNSLDAAEANSHAEDFPGLYTHVGNSREVVAPEVGDSTVGEDIFQTYEE